MKTKQIIVLFFVTLEILVENVNTSPISQLLIYSFAILVMEPAPIKIILFLFMVCSSSNLSMSVIDFDNRRA